MPDSLKQKTTNGIMWSMIERFSVQGIQFVLSFFIARQLCPSDYGLMAMLAIFMALAQMFVDSGFSNALIQKQGRTDIDFSTVFYFNIVIGILLYLIFQFCAPYIADFYNQPQLVDIIIYVALNFIITSFGTVQRAKLTIELDFRRQAYISSVSVIVSGSVAVYMAYNGFGVWTLVVQGLLSNTITTVLLWITAKWHPLLMFSMASFKELFGFGSKLLAGGLMQTIYTNLYSLIIGKLFSPSELGLFSRAQNTTQIPSLQFTQILVRVTYPVECKLQNDDQELTSKFFLFIRLTAYILFPVMIGLSALAEPFIRLVLTDKWIECVPFIQILCFAYMFDPIMRMNWDILNVKHRSDYSLKSEVIKKIVAFSILFMSFTFGLYVICWGLVLYSIADMLIIMQFTKRIIPEINIRNEAKILLPIFILASVSGACAYIVKFFISNDWGQLIVGGVILLSVYFLFSSIFHLFEYRYLLNWIKSNKR